MYTTGVLCALFMGACDEAEISEDLRVAVFRQVEDKVTYGESKSLKLTSNKTIDDFVVNWIADGGQFTQETGLYNTWIAPDTRGVYNLSVDITEGDSIFTLEAGQVEVMGSYFDEFEEDLSEAWSIIDMEGTNLAREEGKLVLKTSGATRNDRVIPFNLRFDTDYIGEAPKMPFAAEMDIKSLSNDLIEGDDYRVMLAFES